MFSVNGSSHNFIWSDSILEDKWTALTIHSRILNFALHNWKDSNDFCHSNYFFLAHCVKNKEAFPKKSLSVSFKFWGFSKLIRWDNRLVVQLGKLSDGVVDLFSISLLPKAASKWTNKPAQFVVLLKWKCLNSVKFISKLWEFSLVVEQHHKIMDLW